MMQHGGVRWAVLILLSLLLCFGCGKKQISSEGRAVSQQQGIQEDQQAMTQAQMDQLAAEKKAKELQERQLADERRMQEERAQQEAQFEQSIGEIQENKIYFDFDSFELKPQARTILQKKAALFKNVPALKMRIEGHCDERGTDEYNLALGEKRARVAYEFLILLGVEPQRLQIISYGEEYPADTGHNETAWAQNRRDEFKVFK